MSGGRLVVLDRAGRQVKQFPLAEGLATLGSDPTCDIRIMLPTVSPHHATVVVHANQTLVRNVCSDETLVNGRCVSVAALRHGDVIGIGGRRLRWEYSQPAARRPQAPEPALYVSRRKGCGVRRGSGPASGSARDPQLQLALEMSHRASMPGSAGGKQVAIVQPRRRDTSDQIDKNPQRTPLLANKRPRTSKSDLDTSTSEAEQENTKRRSTARVSPKNCLSNLQTTTKATLWIESRKTSPRKSNKIQTPTQEQVLRARRSTASAKKSTPLRLTVLKRAQSAQKMRVAKIEGPLTMDHTKQAAIRLMTGHTPKQSPSFVVKKPSPVRRTPRLRNSRATPGNSRATPGNTSNRSGADRTITDSDRRSSSLRNSTASRRSGQKSSKKSTSPRKSALKDPSAKRGARKTESIKFDLSNLENHSQDTDVLMLSDTTRQSYAANSASDDDVTLHYSDSSAQAPSPRRSIHSRSSRILEQTLGTSVSAVSVSPAARSLSPQAPRSKRSCRGSLIVQRALNDTRTSSYSRRTTKSVDNSQNASLATAYRTRTLSPRASRNDLESYSIVDLVSIDTDESALSTSVYGSAGSTASTAYGTPKNGTGRKTRSTIEPTLLGSSTPYVEGRPATPRSSSNPSPHTASNTSMNGTQSTVRSSRSTRSKSLSTPENTEDAKKHISVNSTRISRASRSRSRLNDSELLLDEDDDSPRTSKRISTTSKSGRLSAQIAGSDAGVTPTHSAQDDGTCTPENRHSPEDASTPVLSIQSLLDSSRSSSASRRPARKGRPSFNTKRKTIGGVMGPTTRTRVGAKSKSLSFSARHTRLRLSSDSVEILNKNEDSEIVTPKSAVKLIPEGVKNKHSTAKKPQSKRSIIDDLNESDIVKQLFNSPVKRKLSQSMTEFCRKQLFDEDEFVRPKRATRNTIALTGRTPDNLLLDHTESYTPEIFVSPISTPTRSPSLEGIKLMFAKTTPENDLRDVRGVRNLVRTPRTRRSVKNDLTNVSGVNYLFAKSPKNRLSDVRGVKKLYNTTSPANDLRNVSGVKRTLRRQSPRNDLSDVRGVKRVFRREKRNDLSDMRGVKRVFGREKRNDLSDVSGVDELFNLSNYSSATASTRAESLFEQLVGKPQIRAVYSKTFSSKTVQKNKGPRAKSLHASPDQVTATDNNWLELNKQLQIKNYLDSLKSGNTSKANRSKANKSKPLHASLDEVTDVDVLLQQEQNKEQQINEYLESMRSVNVSKLNKSKVNKCKANRSRVNTSKARTSKANMSRELQKLITETVQGDAPLRTSRVRDSTVSRNESDVHLGRKKSASELYSVHTLPIKKRSLANASETILPLKKRAVVHSTPVKGRLHVTMNASALARVSPIRADETLYTEHDTCITSSQPKETTEVKSKSTRGTRANTENLETANAPEIEKPSPKKTHGRPKAVSPKVMPASPAKEKAAAKASSVKAKKASPIKTKMASPAKAKTPSPAKVKTASPAKAKKVSPTKNRNTSLAKSTVPAKTTRSRRKDVSTLEANTIKRRSTLVVVKKSPVMSPQPRATRKRKEPETPSTPKPSPKKSYVQRKPSSTARAAEVQPKTRGRKTVVSESIDNAVVEKVTAQTKKGLKTDKPAHKKTRSNRQEKSIEEAKPVSTGGKKVESQESVDSALSMRGRRVAKTNIASEVKTRKRKSDTAPDNEIPRKVRKSKEVAERGRKQATVVDTETKKTTRKQPAVNKSKEEKVSEAPAKVTRGRKTAEVEPVKVTRGRKTAEVEPVKITRGKKTVEVEHVKVTRGRKMAEVEPMKVTRGKKAVDVEHVKITRGRKRAEVEPVKVTRGKKTVEVEHVKVIRGRNMAEVEPVKVTRGKKAAKVEPVKVTRGRKTAEVELVKVTRVRKPVEKEHVKVTRGRKTAEVEPVQVTRGRKTVEVEPVKVTRGRKRAEVEPVKDTRGRKRAEVEPVKDTRGRKTAEVEPVKAMKQTEQKTRGRKANIENVPANQVTGKRKRTAAEEPLPVKERKTRAARGNARPEDAVAGRSRRR